MRRLGEHWPEYVSEASALGAFMVSATLCATLLQHPASPAAHLVPAGALGRVPMGMAMALTAVALIYSPPGRRSGAHMNPAVTWAFWRLGKIGTADAVAYSVAQCAGGYLGSALALAALGGLPAHPSVDFVRTTPGAPGVEHAWIAEAAISFVMMLTVLAMSNHEPVAPYTGVGAGLLVALFIVVEAPVSGMSMNPARSLGPALLAGRFDALWIYWTGPPLGMLSAAELFAGVRGPARVRCAKLHHAHGVRCIFHCRHAAALSEIRA